MGLEVFKFSTPQNGVRIAGINEKSQADESGLRVGDTIVAVDRTRTLDPKDLAAILKKHQPGSSLRVQFIRNNSAYVTNVPLIESEFSTNDQTRNARVTAAKPPTESPAAQQIPTQVPTQVQTQSDRVKLGMLIQDPNSLRGTVVTKVRPGSIADTSGLKEGDRIVSVESRVVGKW